MKVIGCFWSPQSQNLASGYIGGPVSAKPLAGGLGEVQALFQLPQQMKELGMKGANLQAPLAPPCLCHQKFMLPAQSIYACRDIREIPREKVVAYARALQHWGEEINSPTGGRPCLLAKSVKELRERVNWYLSFSDKEVFQGVVLPKKDEDQSLETPPTDVPKTPCAPESGMERRGPKFLGWEKILHPSQPVVAAGEISKPSKASSPRVGPIQLPWTVPVKLPASLSKTPTPSKPSSPVQALAVAWPLTLPCSFTGVTACLQMPEPLEMASEMPHCNMLTGEVATPGISTMSMSQIIRDEVTGVTYMDMVTTSIGRVALSGPGPEASSQGPIIEDVTSHQ